MSATLVRKISEGRKIEQVSQSPSTCLAVGMAAATANNDRIGQGPLR
jgi:hypothetical protein